MIRKLLDNIIFFGLSILLALIGSEVLLRVMAKAEITQPVNLIKPEDIDLKFNKDGFRDYDFTSTKEPDIFRILILGNSVTFGVSVTSGQTYVKQLENILNVQGASTKFEVVNVGVPSWNTLYQQKYLESKGMAYKPDLVIIGFTLISAEGDNIPPDDLFSSEELYIDDSEVLHRTAREWAQSVIELHNQGYQISRFRRMSQEVGLFLTNYSSLYRYIRWRIDLTDQPFEVQNYPDFFYTEQAHMHWDLCRTSLTEIEQLLREQNIPVMMVIFPLFVKLKSDANPDERYPWEYLHDLIATSGGDIGMIVVDMLPVYWGMDPRMISVDTYHMNPHGHRIAAEHIYSELIDKQLVPINKR